MCAQDVSGRVAHFRSVFLPHTERFIYNLITGHVRYRALVLASRRENREAMPFAPVVALRRTGRPLLAWAIDRLTGRLWRRELSFVRACRRARVQILHAHFGFEGQRILPLAAHLRIPLVTSFYGHGTAPRHAGTFEELFTRGAAFLVEGPVMKTRLAALGCPSEKIHVVRIGAAALPDGRRHTPTVKDRYRLLFVGRFVEKKGLDVLLAALAHLKADGPAALHLEIVGDAGPLTPQDYRKLARKLGVWDQVTFHGNVPFAELAALLPECDLMVQPSVTAADGDAEGGAPTVLTWAQSAGLPVVATRHCDIPDVVRDGETGRLVGERDPHALADALTELLDDVALRHRMSAAARAHIQERFSLAGQIRETEALYDKLL